MDRETVNKAKEMRYMDTTMSAGQPGVDPAIAAKMERLLHLERLMQGGGKANPTALPREAQVKSKSSDQPHGKKTKTTARPAPAKVQKIAKPKKKVMAREEKVVDQDIVSTPTKKAIPISRGKILWGKVISLIVIGLLTLGLILLLWQISVLNEQQAVMNQRMFTLEQEYSRLAGAVRESSEKSPLPSNQEGLING